MSDDVFFCQRHPSVETGLRCGRCETPICPKCAVFTDVGARCPDCAPRRKLPQFEVSPLYFARGAGAGAGAGALAGAAWGLLVPDIAGLFAILAGAGLGYCIGESISLSTNRKAGVPLQMVAVAGACIAYIARNLVAGYGVFPSDDLWGLVVAGAAAVIAAGRVRF
jgi:hypothetical protein